MIIEKNLTDRNDILLHLNKMICSFSKKSDFHEVEQEFFNTISSIIPAHATALYFFKSSKCHPVYISGLGVDNDFLSYYEKKGREVDPLRNWIMSKHSPNQSQLLLGLKGWQHHPVYNVVKTASIDFAMQAPIMNGEEILGTINFGRELSEGPFQNHDLHTISILSHFLGLAIINSYMPHNSVMFNSNFYNSIDNMKQGMVITDKDYSIDYANNSAKGAIIRNFLSEEPEKEFSNLLKEVSTENTNKKNELVNNLALRSCPMPGSSKRQTIVFIDENPPPILNNSLRSLFTQREIDVLLLVERGMKNRDIAEKLGITVNTVKRHLDNMFVKFNVNSRTKLISKFYYLNNQK